MLIVVRILPVFLATCISVGHGRTPRKIIGGTIAGVSEFPFQVSIRYKDRHCCGGVIIDADHILTVAHCVLTDSKLPINSARLTVWTGMDSDYDGNMSQVYEVCQIIVHKDFQKIKHGDLFGLIRDIAILTLVTPMSFNAMTKRVNLPTHDIQGNEPVTFSGFGSLNCSKKTPYPRSLYKLNLRIISNEKCQVLYPGLIYPEHLCTVHDEGYCGSFGDSGSGLVIGNDTLVGLLTLGTPEFEHAPDVFNRVYTYLPWIQRVLQYLEEIPIKRCRRQQALRI